MTVSAKLKPLITALISLVAATLREIGKQDVEDPTKADETMLLPLAQKMSKVFNRCEMKTVVQTELAGQPQSYWAWMYEPDDSASVLYQNSLKLRGCFPYAKAPHLSAALTPVQIITAP